jgi:hypothetical protein
MEGDKRERMSRTEEEAPALKTTRAPNWRKKPIKNMPKPREVEALALKHFLVTDVTQNTFLTRVEVKKAKDTRVIENSHKRRK